MTAREKRRRADLTVKASLCWPAAVVLSAATSCHTLNSCWQCVQPSASASGACVWCSTPSEKASFGQCEPAATTTSGCPLPSQSLHNSSDQCSISFACAEQDTCSQCTARTGVEGPECGWFVQPSMSGVTAAAHTGCYPASSPDRTVLVTTVAHSCSLSVWITGDVQYGSNAGWIVMVVAIFLSVFWCCRSRSAFSDPGSGFLAQASMVVLGPPCSAAMVTEYFGWRLGDSDGIGPGGNSESSYPDVWRSSTWLTPAEKERHDAAQERAIAMERRKAAAAAQSGSRKNKAKRQKQQAALNAAAAAAENGSPDDGGVHVVSVQVSPSSSPPPPRSKWLQLLQSMCTGASWQVTLWTDLAIFCIFSLSLFVDRWYTTAGAEEGMPGATLMGGDLVWGQLIVGYGGSKPTKTDCTSFPLQYLQSGGLCVAIKALGVLVYLIGLLYFFLLVTRCYTDLYAWLRNVNLVARNEALLHRSRDSTSSDGSDGVDRGEDPELDVEGGSDPTLDVLAAMAGGPGRRRPLRCCFHCGCHLRLVRNFLRVRYARMYVAWIVMLPLAIYRLLMINDGFSVVLGTGNTSIHGSFLGLLLVALIELVMLLYEQQKLGRILQGLDERNAERHRRRRLDDEDEKSAAGNDGASPNGGGGGARGNGSNGRSSHFPASASLMSSHLASSHELHASGAGLDYEDQDHELEHSLAAPSANGQSGNGGGGGRWKDVDLRDHPLIDEEEELQRAERLRVARAHQAANQAAAAAAATEMSVLGLRPPSATSPAHSASPPSSSAAGTSTVTASGRPYLTNHTSYEPQLELDEMVEEDELEL